VQHLAAVGAGVVGREAAGLEAFLPILTSQLRYSRMRIQSSYGPITLRPPARPALTYGALGAELGITASEAHAAPAFDLMESRLCQ